MLFQQLKEPIFARRLCPNGLVTHKSEATSPQYANTTDSDPSHQPPIFRVKFRIREDGPVAFMTAFIRDSGVVCTSFFSHFNH
jgi:hypothetical protein